MGIDNRTELNDCEADAGWNGTDNPDLDNDAGFYYEGAGAMAAQFSNSQEYIIVGENSAGTALNEDLSDSTVWLLVKDNLAETQVNGGFQIVLANGTGGASAIIGFYVGGYDNPGLNLGKFYNCIRLDVSNISAFSSFAHNGTLGGLNTATITDIGYGSVHIATARGNINNLWVDRITTIANGSYALTANGGSVSTPLNMNTLYEDDELESNGWGIVSKGAGSSYTIYASTQFGDTGTGDSYFEENNSQIFLDGTGIGSTHFIFRVIGNSTGTNSFVLDNTLFVGTGEGAIWDFTDTNFDILKLTGTQFVDNGTINFPVASTGNKFVNTSSFIGCGQIDFSTINADDITIKNNSDSATGAMLLDTDGQTTNQTNFTFESGGTGHGVYITAPGTYGLSNWNFSGYSTADPGDNLVSSSGSTDAMVYNNSGGAVQLNVSGGIGGNITIRNGASATTTVVATINITITNIVTGSEVRMYDFTGGVVGDEELGGNTNAFLESITGTSVTFSTVPQKDYLIKIVNPEYVILRVEIPSTGDDVTQKITQVIDRVFDNP